MEAEPEINWYTAEIRTGKTPHKITTTSGPAFAAFLRSIADAADPPRKPTRGRGFDEERWTPPEAAIRPSWLGMVGDPDAGEVTYSTVPTFPCATAGSACPHLALCLVDKKCKLDPAAQGG